MNGPEADEGSGVGERQCAEKHTVDDGEEGGVRADAECQGRDGGEGEGWRATQHAKRVHEVLLQIVHVVSLPAIGFGMKVA